MLKILRDDVFDTTFFAAVVVCGYDNGKRDFKRCILFCHIFRALVLVRQRGKSLYSYTTALLKFEVALSDDDH